MLDAFIIDELEREARRRREERWQRERPALELPLVDDRRERDPRSEDDDERSPDSGGSRVIVIDIA